MITSTIHNKTIVNDLICTAATSEQTFRLSATLLNGSKKMYNPVVNCDRRYCRGKVCPSLHAEAGILLRHYGKRLRYSDSHGWCLLREKAKGKKERKGQKVRFGCS